MGACHGCAAEPLACVLSPPAHRAQPCSAQTPACRKRWPSLARLVAVALLLPLTCAARHMGRTAPARVLLAEHGSNEEEEAWRPHGPNCRAPCHAAMAALQSSACESLVIEMDDACEDITFGDLTGLELPAKEVTFEGHSFASGSNPALLVRFMLCELQWRGEAARTRRASADIHA